ncbi:MAG: hypothetical protein RL684_1249 [Pseudomonadota bacterium]|jgi:xanthine/uracil permease
MRPWAVLLGIITGSCVAIAVALGMTGIVFLFLPEYAAQISAERRPLLVGIALSWALSAVAGAAFVGELRHRAWRWVPQGALLAGLAALAWHYWPA